MIIKHTDANKECLRQLWCEEGLTAGQIAKAMGMTRNAVMGLVHRNKWQRSAKTTPAPPRWTNKQVAILLERWGKVSRKRVGEEIGRSRAAVAAKGRSMNLPHYPQPYSSWFGTKPQPPKHQTYAKPIPVNIPIPPRRETMVAVPVDPVTFWELKPGVCKYPINDPPLESLLFCGSRAIDGRSYCWKHHRLSYQPLKGSPGYAPPKRFKRHPPEKAA